MSNLDSKVDTTKVRVEELKDKWGSSELKIEKLKRGHQEIKGNPMTSLYYQNWYKEIFLLTEKQTDIDQKIREILESVTGLKSLTPPPEISTPTINEYEVEPDK